MAYAGRGFAAGLAAAMALVVVMALVAEPGGSSGSEMGRSRAALLELGEEPRTDLRLALALEVSKKRYNKAQKKLEGLRQQLTGDFDELKKWTVEKQEAKAQLENVIAENDPTSVAQNSDETVAAPLTVSRSGEDHLSVSRSGEDHAARADVRGSALHLSSARHAKVGRAAAASAPTSRPRSSAEDTVVSNEMGDIMKQQMETQSEVSALAQQMKAMIGSQVHASQDKHAASWRTSTRAHCHVLMREVWCRPSWTGRWRMLSRKWGPRMMGQKHRRRWCQSSTHTQTATAQTR